MSSITAFADEITGNPLDLIEQLVIAHEWPHDRQSDEDMAVEIAGKYCDYRLWFAWRPDIGALHLSVALDMKVQKAKRAQIIELLAALNERLWLGHFDLWSDERVPMFRYTMLVRGGGLTAGHVEGGGRDRRVGMRTLLPGVPVRDLGWQERRGGRCRLDVGHRR